MSELPEGRICHLTSERVRIRISERRRDEAFFDAVKERLSRWSSVKSVEVNPITASVLVYFTGASSLFIDHQQRNDLFRLTMPEPEMLRNGLSNGGAPLLDRARSGVERVDLRLHDRSGGQVDLRSLAFLGLVGAGLVQLANGCISAPAITLFWYAGDLLGIWRPSDRQALAGGSTPHREGQAISGNGSAAV